MESRAAARYVRVGPKKARMLRAVILGKDAAAADGILANTAKGPATVVRKLIKSAVSNGKQRGGGEDWTVTNLLVDGGPILKRFRAAPQGRGVRIRKRTSHITIVLEGAEARRKR